MGRVYEHLSRGTRCQDRMDEDSLWNSMEDQDNDMWMSDESLDEYAYDYEKEAKKKH